MVDRLLDGVGRWIGRRLEAETSPASGGHFAVPTDILRRTLQPGDVLLVEGGQKISTAIKYLTQSTWSHAALYVGALPKMSGNNTEPVSLIEANIGTGVCAVPLSKYGAFHTRICRPVGLSEAERHQVVQFAIERIGLQYDTRNIIDLARYLMTTPPIPSRWRRRMIALGSGNPTRAICSTLIAQAFQSVRYPIIPSVTTTDGASQDTNGFEWDEVYHIRHHSLFAPRDFDLSPYFQIVKPTVHAPDFNFHHIRWSDDMLQPSVHYTPARNLR